MLFDATHAASPIFPAVLIGVSAVLRDEHRRRGLAWIDPDHTFFPPAVIAMGLPQEQLHLLRPRAEDLVWTTIECLRCSGLGAVIARIDQPLTRVQVRQLQLAAEKGGGLGLLIRPHNKAASIYAAATRWLVAPAPGERTIQRWTISLLHGHGRRTGQTFLLEKHRASSETHIVPVLPAVADQPTRAASP